MENIKGSQCDNCSFYLCVQKLILRSFHRFYNFSRNFSRVLFGDLDSTVEYASNAESTDSEVSAVLQRHVNSTKRCPSPNTSDGSE